MPYDRRPNPPGSVRENLPPRAPDIYRSAFKDASEEYGYDEPRAHGVARGAVERKYHKDESGNPVPRGCPLVPR
jgi:cation transport regulator